MSLPLAISGISTTIAPVGPFKVPAGKYFSTAIDTVGVSNTAINLTGSGTAVAIGQSVTNVASSTAIAQVIANVWKSGSPTDNIYCQITQTDPSGTVLATSDNIACSSLGTSLAQVTFSFPSPATISSSATFGVVFRRSGTADASNFPIVGTNAASSYAGGQRFTYNGTTWSGVADDIRVQIQTATTLSDAYYFFGRDSTTGTTLQAYKATDPTSSWSSIATKTGFATAIAELDGAQDASLNLFHLFIGDGAVNYKYQTFDAITDTFVTAETIASGLTTTGQQGSAVYSGDLVVRQNGEVVAFFNGTQTKTSGTFYARVYYSRRTGVNTWSAATEVDGATAIDTIYPEVVQGSSNRLHFFFSQPVTNRFARSLSAANVLGTLRTSANINVNANENIGISFSSGSKVRSMSKDTGGFINNMYFDSADDPTTNNVQIADSGTSGYSVRPYYDSGTGNLISFFPLGYDNNFLYLNTSTDGGVTWPGSSTPGLIVSSAPTGGREWASRQGTVYQRGTSVVVPMIYNISGTWYYNEYLLRSIWDGQATLGGLGSLSADTASGGAGTKVGAATLNGLGNLSVLVNQQYSATAQFNGAGSLSALVSINLAASAQLSGAGSLSANVQTVKIGAATLAGASTLSANAQNTKTGQATFTGTGNLSALVGQGMPVSASFAGAGNLSALSALAQAAAATFVGVGNLSALVMAGRAAAATLQGIGNLSALVGVGQAAAATLQGSSTLSADVQQSTGAAGNVWSGEATFNGTGSLQVDTQNTKIGAATLSGSGGLSASTSQILAAQATLSGGSSLQVDCVNPKPSAATLNGTGSLSAVSGLSMAVQATLAGAGTLSVDTQVSMSAQATLAGTGSLSAIANMAMVASATLNGAGGLSTNAVNTKVGQATLTGAGALSGYASITGGISAVLGGLGSLSGFASITGQSNTWSGEATLNGTGGLSVTVQQQLAAQATLGGAGGLTASLSQRMVATARFAGASTLQVDLFNASKFLEATLPGTGSLSARVSQGMAVSASFAGASTLSVAVRASYAASVQFTGTGVMLALVSQVNTASARLDGSGGLSAFVNQIFFGANAYSIEARLGGRGGLSAQAQRVAPAKFYDYPIRHDLDSDYGMRRARLGRGRLIIGRR